MEQVVFGRWRLRHDRQATQRSHSAISIGDPERCGCCYCRNFAAARDQVYPAEVRSLFQGLGIDSSKEAEVYQICWLRPGFQLYGGWFHCVGRIESEGEEVGKYDLEGGPGPFKLYFHERAALVPDCFQGLPVLQLEFEAHVPWVLEEPDHEGGATGEGRCDAGVRRLLRPQPRPGPR